MDARERIAFHESGHAVVATMAGVKVAGAAILAEADSAGKAYLASSDADPIALAFIFLAGAAAVRRAYPNESAVVAGVDLICARELLRDPADSEVVLQQVLALAEREVAALVVLGWSAIARVASELSKCGYISGEEVRDLCAPVAARRSE
jgi:Zn-dependent protease